MRNRNAFTLIEPATVSDRERRAFTLIELLVVIAIVTLLLAILMPSMNKAIEISQRTVCGSNIHQLSIASLTYAADFHGMMPADDDTGNGTWMWDLTRDVTDALVSRNGEKIDVFYDPSSPEQNADTHWEFSPEFRVTGYWFTYQRMNGYMSTFANLTSGQPWVSRITTAPGPNGRQPVLIADATVSVNYDFTQIVGGSPIYHRTPHLDETGETPDGGNIGTLDGATQWRQYEDMQIQLPDPQQWF